MEKTYNTTESLMRLMRAMRRRPREEGHLSRGHSKLIRIISAHDGASARELSELMDIRPSSLTEMLNRLEESGAIVRTRDETDMRMVNVSITELGTESLKHHEEARQQSTDFVAECLNEEEQKTFCELCDRVVASVEKRNSELHPRGNHHEKHHRRHDHRVYHHRESR